MKRYAAYLLILTLIACCVLPVAASETTEPTAPVRAPGQCGENMTWEYEDGVLTISGSGAMDDFAEEAPWEAYKAEIHTVVLAGSVSYIGRNAFRNYDQLTNVDFGSALREIGPDAFRSCDGLTEIFLPQTFKIFGEQCFMGCKNLKEIHTEGREASFRNNSMWDVYAVIYFPADRPWGVGYIEQMETVFKGRIEFRASDGSDPYNPTEPTEEPTEPSSQPTEPSTEPTEPSSEPTEATQPTETETQPRETEDIREPAHSATEGETEAEMPSMPPRGDDGDGGSILMGVAAVAALMALLLLVAVVMGKINRKGKYSR